MSNAEPLTASRAMTTNTASNRLIPYGVAGGSSITTSVLGKSQSKMLPETVTTTREQNAKAIIVIGFESVRPYNIESGSNSGDESANAKIVPTAMPLRRNCFTIGITPNEQPGSNMPISQD